MSGKRKRKSERTISAAHEGKKPKSGSKNSESDTDDKISLINHVSKVHDGKKLYECSKSDTDGENSGSEDEDQNSENYTEDKNNCVKFAAKTNQIQSLEIANEEADLEDYFFSVEFLRKNCKIQALEIANDEVKNKLKTEVASAKKALEESKANAKVELEKVEFQLQTEVASNKSLEESLSKYRIMNQDAKNNLEAMEELSNKFRKISQDWTVKVYQSNPTNEDLAKLLSLEPEKLFEKYEQITKFNESNMVKVEEVDYAMKDKKLNLQILQRELYEKELDKIMDVLKIPSGDRVYTNILPMIKDLVQQNDTDHYTNVVENLINE